MFFIMETLCQSNLTSPCGGLDILISTFYFLNNLRNSLSPVTKTVEIVCHRVFRGHLFISMIGHTVWQNMHIYNKPSVFYRVYFRLLCSKLGSSMAVSRSPTSWLIQSNQQIAWACFGFTQDYHDWCCPFSSLLTLQVWRRGRGR